ncbi:MAG: BolA family transcriptional regulator [Gammaproteobacteria bacterium]|jgi:BolA protein|nr:BolA family transcriptional regulator [Gammaproteobacteria bacterium]MBT4608127.1 BolA family transcriptional regulator [Thiotrichales bacterium]MBT3471213.1 BolA family transcriptional regulator [Gammaproteobacteria bacterium]MBT3966644.1 BolA family transcriptional regulator [Gammaproteobacteria bacterium]MBT4081114.1 BolA family transcriptional regulator [Gammaproteobacteria bacterium]
MTPEQRIEAIDALLTEQLAPSFLKIEDNSAEHAGHQSAGGAGHYTIHIAADLFEGKSLIQKHRLVYGAVDSLMETEIHALSIKLR